MRGKNHSSSNLLDSIIILNGRQGQLRMNPAFMALVNIQMHTAFFEHLFRLLYSSDGLEYSYLIRLALLQMIMMREWDIVDSVTC